MNLRSNLYFACGLGACAVVARIVLAAITSICPRCLG